MAFTTNSKQFNFKNNLNDLQKKRHKDHIATVTVDADGKFETHSDLIITPQGRDKINKRVSVLPDSDETVVKMTEATYLFKDLQQMNLILTNACNLACTYCYEQHNRDFGRFTNESLLEAYNFLLNSSDHEKKIFQFFGGEPLIHKDLILDFLRDNKEYLEANSKGWTKQYVSCVTNGLLITQDFMDEYFDYDFTFMLVSLDTIRAEVDHREIGQKKIDALIKTLHKIPQKAKDTQRITMRCTLAKENAPYFKEFVKAVYDAGVRNIVVHPLILDSSRGFIAWTDNEWNTLHQDILWVLDYYFDLAIHFSEGVGQKGENNCMVGSDMVAIDASGDYSGCYFFTNQKAGPAGKTILGNVFEDRLYLDRYKGFQQSFSAMVETEEQCRTCDYKNACYQCPAGNMDTGTRLFRPDDMCQKIVKLYVDLQEDVHLKMFKKKFDDITEACNNEGEEKIFIRAPVHLMFKMFSNYHASRDDTEWGWKEVPSHEQLLYAWVAMIEDGYKQDKPNFENFMADLKKYITKDRMTVKDLYEWMCEKAGIPIQLSKEVTDLNFVARVSYLVFLHFLILHNEKVLRGANVESVRDKLLKSK
jgi:uncharacterized protein